MRKNVVLFIVVTSIIIFSSCFQQHSVDETYREGWSLVWEEDFTEFPDETVWSKTLRDKPHMYRYMSDNNALFVLKDGNIVLRGMVAPDGEDELPFLTGGINTEAFKIDDIKRIEIRARINPTSDVTPYITLVPNNSNDNILIDIVEQYGTDNFVYQSVTSEYTTTEGMPDNPTSSVLVRINPSEYHIYSVEKYPDSLVFYIDGSRIKEYPRISTEIPGQFPYNDLNFNLYIGLRLNSNIDTANLPVDFYIDWVRYYDPLAD